ncbi:MAG: hypothetical protein R3D60_01345 [Paracoccaceae bacterium]
MILNVLLVGVLVGGAVRNVQMAELAPMRPDFRQLWRALPEDVQQDLRNRSREQGFHDGGRDAPREGGQRPSREERAARIEQMNARVLTILRTQPFDPAAFEAYLAGDREAAQQRIEAARTAFAERVAQMTDEERAEMAQRLERNLRRRGP